MPIGGGRVSGADKARKGAASASKARGKPFESGERAREMGRRGGIRSGQVKRERRQMREIAQSILDMPMRKGRTEAYRSFIEGSAKNVTVSERIVMVAIKEALEGNMRAAEFVRDTAGERPTETVAVAKASAEASAEFMALLEDERGE